jgi:hypothetical protein
MNRDREYRFDENIEISKLIQNDVGAEACERNERINPSSAAARSDLIFVATWASTPAEGFILKAEPMGAGRSLHSFVRVMHTTYPNGINPEAAPMPTGEATPNWAAFAPASNGR